MLQIVATSLSASLSDGDCTGGRRICSGVFSTNLGMSLSSISMLIGVDDAEEHGIPGVKAGHMHFSALQS